LIAEGQGSEAQTQLTTIIPGLRSNGAQTVSELALSLQSLGEILAAEGQVRQAVAPLREAVSLRERSGDPSWELAVARERLGEALSAEDSPEARDLLQKALTELKTQLGVAHPEAMRAQHALNSLRPTL